MSDDKILRAAQIRALTALARSEPDDECPLCHSGTVEHVDGEVRCRGECGATARLTKEGVKVE